MRALAACGVRVAIFDLNEERGRQLADEVGGIYCHCDIALDASVDAALARARRMRRSAFW